jgi:ATP-dependent RNA helicase HelY
LLEGLYHESDLLLAEVIEAGFLDGLEPALVAGALSALVFEPRHARVAPPTNPKKIPKRAKGALPDRLGGPRQRELKERTELIVARSEALHVLETHHKIPRSRKADGGIATAIASWARGAPLGVVLDVARRDIGDVAAGDFVRIAKQVADLCEQVSYAQTHPDLMESATEARGLIVRSVVAAGGLEVSANQS